MRRMLLAIPVLLPIGAATAPLLVQPAALAAPSPVSSEQVSRLAEDWSTAISTGNLEGWMNMHAETIEFANHGWFTGKTREEMRRWGQAVIDAGGVYRIEEERVEGNERIWLIDYKDRSFAIKEMGRVSVENGKITRLILGNRPN